MTEEQDKDIQERHVTQEETGRWSNEPVPAPESVSVRPQGKLQLVHALLTQPLIVALGSALLALVAVVGLALNWGRTVISAGSPQAAGAGGAEDAEMDFTVSGFGLVKGSFQAANVHESWLEATFLSISMVLVFLVLASAVLIAFTPLRRIAAVIAAGTGIGFVAYSVYGLVTGLGIKDNLFSGDTSGLGEQESALVQEILDSMRSTTGPGEYVVLVAGILLALLGGYFAVRAGVQWLPGSSRRGVQDAPDVSSGDDEVQARP